MGRTNKEGVIFFYSFFRLFPKALSMGEIHLFSTYKKVKICYTYKFMKSNTVHNRDGIWELVLLENQFLLVQFLGIVNLPVKITQQYERTFRII